MAFDRELDEIDWRLLRELQENARQTFAKLGRKVNLTQPAVAERVRRLEETGVIQGYRAELSYVKLNLPMMAFIRVATGGEEQCAKLALLARQLPEVLEGHRITGEASYILKCVVPSVTHLEKLIDRLMPFGQPATSIVLSSPVTHRILGPLSAEPARRLRKRVQLNPEPS